MHRRCRHGARNARRLVGAGNAASRTIFKLFSTGRARLQLGVIIIAFIAQTLGCRCGTCSTCPRILVASPTVGVGYLVLVGVYRAFNTTFLLLCSTGDGAVEALSAYAVCCGCGLGPHCRHLYGAFYLWVFLQGVWVVATWAVIALGTALYMCTKGEMIGIRSLLVSP